MENDEGNAKMEVLDATKKLNLVVFLLVIIFSVLPRFKASDYPKIPALFFNVS
jgi:hypothetical protein